MSTNKSYDATTAGILLAAIGLCLLAAGIASSFAVSTQVFSSPTASPVMRGLVRILAVSDSQSSAWEILLKGVLLTFCGSLVLLRWNLVRSIAGNESMWLWAALFVLLITWVPIGILGHSVRVVESLYWWLGDDAMISMRYAHNLASGLGLVWNPGERVEGYSNFLWTVYMAGVHLLGIPTSRTSFVIILTNIVLSAVSIPLLARLVRLMGGGSLALVFSLGAFVLSKHSMYWATEGVETCLLTFLVLLGTCRVLQESRSDIPRFSTYIIISALSLVRADGFVLSGLLYAASLALNKDKKRVLTFSALSIALPLAHLAFRILYYGDFLPNTAHLKVLYWDQRYALGCNFALQFYARFVLPILLAIIGCLITRDKARVSVMGVVLGYTGYVAWVGGDAFPAFRFMVPVEPLLFVCSFLGVQCLPLKSACRAAVAVLCIVSMPLIISPAYLDLLKPQSWYLANIRRALLIKANTPPTTRVADLAAGAMFYFSERPGVDLLGKVDPHIARLPARCSTSVPGHNKFDFDYSLGVLKPDLVVCKYNQYTVESMHPAVERDCLPLDTILYFHPLFRKHCLPNTVNVEEVPTIFICDWSPEVDRRDKWKESEPLRQLLPP